jgi:hypothetical protein
MTDAVEIRMNIPFLICPQHTPERALSRRDMDAGTHSAIRGTSRIRALFAIGARSVLLKPSVPKACFALAAVFGACW